MIAIDKGIPIPNPESGRRRKYPFDKMEVGDSIFIEMPEGRAFTGHSAYALAKQEQTRTGRKFQANYVEGGFRIWRIE